MNLNLTHIKGFNVKDNANSVDKLVKEGPCLGNKYIDEWRRYLKYAIENDISDSNGDIFIKKEDAYKISMVYSSDTKEKVDKIIKSLVESVYLYDNGDCLFFNEDKYTNHILGIEGESIDDKVNLFKKPFLSEPWEVMAVRKGYYILGESEITKNKVSIGMVPMGRYGSVSFEENAENIALRISKAPYIYNLLNYIYPVAKKNGDFSIVKSIKDVVYNIENFDREIIRLNSKEELDAFVDGNRDEALKAIDMEKVLGCNQRIVEISDINGPIFISKVEGIDTMSIISSLGLICKMDEILMIVKECIEKLSLSEEIKVKIRGIVEDM